MELIALRTVRYNDRHSILSAYTAGRGRVSLLVPATASKEARRMRALLMPLSVAEGEIDFRPDRSIFNLRSVRPAPGITPLQMSGTPLRGMLAMFMADVVECLVRESPPDEAMFGFVRQVAARIADAPRHWLPNLHLIALARLTGIAGIEPDTATARPGRFLDMTDGVWRTSPPLHGSWLEPGPSRLAAILAAMDWHHAPLLHLDGATRRAAIDSMVAYFESHLGPMRLPSLAVLREL